MQVERDEDGTWKVTRSGATLAKGLTNEQAWRYVDRNTTEDIRMENIRRRVSSAFATR